MGLTASLVNVTPDELVYQIINESEGEGGFGTTLTITANGTFSITAGDLVLDCIKNTWGRAACTRLRQVCRAGVDGLGAVVAGAWTQAQTRDLLLGNGAVQTAGSPLMPRAEVDLQPVNGTAGGCLIEADTNANVDGTPMITLTAVGAAGQALLRVRLRSTPGIR